MASGRRVNRDLNAMDELGVARTSSIPIRSSEWLCQHQGPFILQASVTTTEKSRTVVGLCRAIVFRWRVNAKIWENCPQMNYILGGGETVRHFTSILWRLSVIFGIRFVFNTSYCIFSPFCWHLQNFKKSVTTYRLFKERVRQNCNTMKNLSIFFSILNFTRFNKKILWMSQTYIEIKLAKRRLKRRNMREMKLRYVRRRRSNLRPKFVLQGKSNKETVK